jgi:hypothetical protein
MRAEVVVALCLIGVIVVCATVIVVSLDDAVVQRSAVAASGTLISGLFGWVAGRTGR